MGKLFIEKILKLSFLGILVLGTVLLAPNKPAQAQNCFLQNTFPNNKVKGNSHFGADRGGRRHAGIDLFFPAETTQVAMPEGCKVRLYSDGTPIWKSDPTGYGQYVFLDCKSGAIDYTLRYAHIAGTSGNMITQGRTGIEDKNILDHYHFEVLINKSGGKGTPIDPECILGMDKNDGGSPGVDPSCHSCPVVGPFNFCENKNKHCELTGDSCETSGIDVLLAHSASCYKGEDKNNPGGATIDPSQLDGKTFGDPTLGVGDKDGDGDESHSHDYKEPGDDDGYKGNPDKLYPPPPDDPNPPPKPPTPPPPVTPGKPGDSADLVPEAKETPDELIGCASDTWTAMVNQAVMETRREDIMNKRFILKPDSVLDYSCFDFFVKQVADKAGPIFSESKDWVNRKVSLYGKTVTLNRELGSKSLDNALMDVVQSSLINYRRGQFNNKFLADSEPVDATAGQENCDVMAKVWQVAKCKNFENAPTIYYTFKDLTKTDPREFPSNMKCD